MNILTAREAAAFLKVHPITIFRLFNAGRLPGIILREGARRRTIRFSEDVLEQFITNSDKTGEVEGEVRACGQSHERARGKIAHR